MAKDDELRSVRIELEDGAAPTPAAPVLNGEPNDADGSKGPSAWVIILAILVIGVVGAGVLSLRPDGDTAADGTSRGTTRTTVPEEEDDESEAADAPADEEAGEQGVGEATEQALNEGAGLVPTPLVTGDSVSQIVAADIGYIALGQNGGAQPTVLRSVDGEDWFDVDTTALINGELNEDRLLWFNFLRFGDALVVTGLADTNEVLPERTVFVSERGAEWVDLDLATSSDGVGINIFPFNFVGDSIFGIQFGPITAFEEFLTSTTTIELPEAGVCDIFEQPDQPGEVRFEVLDCLGMSSGFLNIGSVRPELNADDVLDCAQALPRVFGQSFELVRQSVSSTDDLVNLGAITPTDLPVNIGTEGIAAIDAGQIDEPLPEPCQEFIDAPEPSDPAIFVADVTSPDSRRYGFPEGASPFDAQTSSILVGEVTVTGADQLIVVHEDALWALDLETENWEGPLTSPETPFPNGFQQAVTLSDSGTRAYAIANSLLITFDFVEADDGSLQVFETIEPIQPVGGPRSSLDFAGILYADDEILFLGDGLDAWSLETPPRPGE